MAMQTCPLAKKLVTRFFKHVGCTCTTVCVQYELCAPAGSELLSHEITVPSVTVMLGSCACFAISEAGRVALVSKLSPTLQGALDAMFLVAVGSFACVVRSAGHRAAVSTCPWCLLRSFKSVTMRCSCALACLKAQSWLFMQLIHAYVTLIQRYGAGNSKAEGHVCGGGNGACWCRRVCISKRRCRLVTTNVFVVNGLIRNVARYNSHLPHRTPTLYRE